MTKQALIEQLEAKGCTGVRYGVRGLARRQREYSVAYNSNGQFRRVGVVAKARTRRPEALALLAREVG